MIVSKIVKKDANNVIVKFDNDEQLILSVDVFMQSGLKKNDEISEDRFSSLIQENILFHIKQRAFRYLGRRLYSKKELRTKLLQKKYDKKLVDRVIDYLEEKDYLNDKDFAEAFVKDKIILKKWGEQKLKSELIKKGIQPDVISGVLSEQLSDEVVLSNLKYIAEKKYKTLIARGKDKDYVKQKLITFLKSRGYNYEAIKRVCDEILNDEIQ